MQVLKINTSAIRLAINDDENRIVEFDPEDQGFVNRYYTMMANFDEKKNGFIEKAKFIDEIDGVNSYGIKLSNIEGNKLVLEMCDYMKEQIDFVFGKGTSEKVFGNMMRLDMFDQFLEGISGYVMESRNSKMEKYLKNNKGVMK